MRRLAPLAITVLGALASAAEVTRVASSFEDQHPFGMYLDFTFDRAQDKGTITREWYVGGASQDVRELQYLRLDTALQIDAHLGLYRDLELHVGVPVVFQQDRSWAFDTASGPATTSIYRNCVSARGISCATPGQGTGHLFEVGSPTTSYRGGLGDFTFGLAWAPFVQRKDPSKPTWVLRLDWTAPTAARLDPTVATSATSRGAIGQRIHQYTFTTALSKRLYFAEPYFELHYTLPWVGSGAYSNCEHPSALARGENCGTLPWTRQETGIKPPHTGGVSFGTELTFFERPEVHQRLALDLKAWVTYVSQGRYENELTDLLAQRLLSSSDYVQLGGQVGLVGQAAEFITLKASASLAYDTAHFLTDEPVALQSFSLNAADLGGSVPQLNPSYDARVDRPGQRFRMNDEFVFRIQVTSTFNF
jgi:hypothetical protein